MTAAPASPPRRSSTRRSWTPASATGSPPWEPAGTTCTPGEAATRAGRCGTSRGRWSWIRSRSGWTACRCGARSWSWRRAPAGGRTLLAGKGELSLYDANEAVLDVARAAPGRARAAGAPPRARRVDGARPAGGRGVRRVLAEPRCRTTGWSLPATWSVGGSGPAGPSRSSTAWATPRPMRSMIRRPSTAWSRRAPARWPRGARAAVVARGPERAGPGRWRGPGSPSVAVAQTARFFVMGRWRAR